MFSIARSRFALATQFVFFIVNCLGVLFGTVYNVNTPDLYKNNAHHQLGWIVTWIMAAQILMSLLFTYSRHGKQHTPISDERAAFLPLTVDNMDQHDIRPYADYRWSGDSGQGTEHSSRYNSRDISPTDPERRGTYDDFEKPEPDSDDDDHDEATVPRPSTTRWPRLGLVGEYLHMKMPTSLPDRALCALELLYDTIDKSILILGFVTITSGGVTYVGIFVSIVSAAPKIALQFGHLFTNHE